MSMHDWTRVEAGIFHAFHTSWIVEIQNALNEHLLPSDYYALAEQHAGRMIADVLTLHATPDTAEPLPPLPPDTGGVAVAEAPPRVRWKQMIDETSVGLRRTLAIRHVSGHRLVALLEIVSPANKDRAESIEAFATKAVAALHGGMHLLLVDLFPPGPFDPEGMHGAILDCLGPADEPHEMPPDEPLTLASYAANGRIEAYLEHLAVGGSLPEMPLFFRPERYVNVPLAETYKAAYRGMPAFWREVLEKGPS